jgi:hypothetical protein
MTVATAAKVSSNLLILLSSPPLPRGCSTTELRQQPDEMNLRKNRGDHCHMGGIGASAPGIGCGAAAIML